MNIEEYLIKCEHCGDLMDDENTGISILNEYTEEMLNVCYSCYNQLRGKVEW